MMNKPAEWPISNHTWNSRPSSTGIITPDRENTNRILCRRKGSKTQYHAMRHQLIEIVILRKHKMVFWRGKEQMSKKSNSIDWKPTGKASLPSKRKPLAKHNKAQHLSCHPSHPCSCIGQWKSFIESRTFCRRLPICHTVLSGQMLCVMINTLQYWLL